MLGRKNLILLKAFSCLGQHCLIAVTKAIFGSINNAQKQQNCFLSGKNNSCREQCCAGRCPLWNF